MVENDLKVLSAAEASIKEVSNINELGAGVVFFRTTPNAVGLPTGCNEIVGIHIRRSNIDFCGFQLCIGHFNDGEQLITRGIWKSSANWYTWLKLLDLGV